MRANDISTKKFISDRIETTIASEKGKDVGFGGLMLTVWQRRVGVNCLGSALFEAFVLDGSEGERGRWGEGGKKFGNEVWIYDVVTVNKADIVAGSMRESEVASS